MKILKSTLLLASFILLVSLASCIKTAEPIETVKAKENDATIQAYLKAKNITAIKTDIGIYYVITKTNSTGKVPATGDLVTFQYQTGRLDGLKLDSTTVDKPGYSPFGTVDNLWSYLSTYLKEGEKLTAYVPFNFGYGANDRTNLPGYSPVAIDFSIIKLRTEAQQIDNYLTENKLSVTTTGTGLRYNISNPIAKGDTLKKGQKIAVKYTGKLLYYTSIVDAAGAFTKVFDSGTFTFTLGNGEVVAGFDEGISKFKVGEKGVIAFPSELGYKDVKQTKFPAKTPLLFEIEIVSAQ